MLQNCEYKWGEGKTFKKKQSYLVVTSLLI